MAHNPIQHALLDACDQGDPRAALAAIALGAEASATDDLGFTPLMRAAMSGCCSCAKLLIESGADPKAASTAERRHALTFAAGNGHMEMVRLLLPLSDPRSADADGCDALMAAAWGLHHGCIELLLPACDPMARDCEGLDALSIAATAGDGLAVAMLLPASDPLASDWGGATALMRCAASGDIDAIAVLLPASDPSARDARGLAAADIAREGGSECAAAFVECYLAADEALASIGSRAAAGDLAKRRRKPG